MRHIIRFVLIMVVVFGGMNISAGDPSKIAKSNDGELMTISCEVKKVQLQKKPFPTSVINFEVTLKIHFKNNSESSLLLFTNDLYPWVGGIYLATSREDALSKNFVLSSEALLSSDPPTWNAIRHNLDKKSPPSNLIRIIEPNAEWIFDKTVPIGIQIKGSFDKRSKPWEVIKKADLLWLQLMFQLWPQNLETDERNPQFGLKLQKRWKDQGHLIIDYIRSDPVPLKLPSLVQVPSQWPGTTLSSNSVALLRWSQASVVALFHSFFSFFGVPPKVALISSYCPCKRHS